jgi:translation initiation factor 3 subunit D
VFATDTIIAALMTAPRSVYSWDLVFTRIGEQLFIDKRDGSQFDFVTVGETAPSVQFEDRADINLINALTLEATDINDNFQQQLLKQGEVHTFEHPTPFDFEEGTFNSIGYRYRKWNLGNELDLIIRTEIDGIMKLHDQDAFINIKTLNEYDFKTSSVDYRQKIDSQRGAVLATEARNNSYKMSRWIAQSLLAGVEQMKLG